MTNQIRTNCFDLRPGDQLTVDGKLETVLRSENISEGGERPKAVVSFQSGLSVTYQAWTSLQVYRPKA